MCLARFATLFSVSFWFCFPFPLRVSYYSNTCFRSSSQGALMTVKCQDVMCQLLRAVADVTVSPDVTGAYFDK